MLKKKIIPCLDVAGGRTVKGVNFLGLRDAGDPVELAACYSDQGADELVFLDISATVETRRAVIPLVEKVSRRINIPFSVGGGINSLESACEVISAGADKVCVNSAAVRNPGLITTIAKELGSQAVVVAVDVLPGPFPEVAINGGSTRTGIHLLQWARQAEEAGAGEILLTSMGRDGTLEGFDIALCKAVAEQVSVPVIASGGAGKKEDFRDLFNATGVTGALAASIFHFGTITIPDLKYFLKNHKVPVR